MINKAALTQVARLAAAALLGGGALTTAPRSAAAPVPAALFSDNAVLQQDALVPVWGTARTGERVTVTLANRSATATTGPDGRWMVRLGRLSAGGPHTLLIQGDDDARVTIRNVLVGEVWLASGQSNMDFTVARTEKKYFAGVANEADEIAAARWPQIRQFTVDLKLSDVPQSEVTGHWSVCSPSTVGDFSAVAYFFARDIHQARRLPVGIINSSWGASTAEAWTSHAALAAVPDLKPIVESFDAKRAGYTPEVAARDALQQAAFRGAAARAKALGAKAPRARRPLDPRLDQHNASVCFNGMIQPVAPYAIRGALWYQGESNGPTADRYALLMRTLIADWRREWGAGDFPFLFVQLANLNKPPVEPVAGVRGTPRVREGQLQTLRAVRNTAMASAIDLGEEKDVHPRNKQEVWRRLALAARATVYNEKLPYSGPLYAGMTIQGSAIRIRFTHTNNGLVGRGAAGKLVGFALAGADQKWVWADAHIDGNTVVVSSVSVPAPVAVRYAWVDNPPLSLFNGAGLPASPFRTDDETTWAPKR